MASFCGILNKMSQGEGAKDRRPPPVRLWQHENSSLQRTHGIIPSMLEKVRTIIVSISFKIFVKVNSQLLRWGTYEWIKEERKIFNKPRFLKNCNFSAKKKISKFLGGTFDLSRFCALIDEFWLINIKIKQKTKLARSWYIIFALLLL